MEVDSVAESVKLMFLNTEVIYILLAFIIYIFKLDSLLILKFFPRKTNLVNIQTLDSQKKSYNDSQIAAVQYFKNCK